MNCMNCDRALDSAEELSKAKVYAEVLVCERCYLTAERLFQRLKKDLDDCLLIVRDKTRELLATGKFFPSGDTSNPEISKKELLTAITSLYTSPHGTNHTKPGVPPG